MTPPRAPTDDDRLEEALEESFPASDPPSVTRPHDLDPDGPDKVDDDDEDAAG